MDRVLPEVKQTTHTQATNTHTFFLGTTLSKKCCRHCWGCVRTSSSALSTGCEHRPGNLASPHAEELWREGWQAAPAPTARTRGMGRGDGEQGHHVGPMGWEAAGSCTPCPALGTASCCHRELQPYGEDVHQPWCKALCGLSTGSRILSRRDRDAPSLKLLA